MKRFKKWVSENKGMLIKIGIGTGIAAVSAYLGYKYALSIEDVIDMRDEKQAQLVDRVILYAQELGSLTQVKFIKDKIPEAADIITGFISTHPDADEKFPAITYDLAKGTAESIFDDGVKVTRF